LIETEKGSFLLTLFDFPINIDFFFMQSDYCDGTNLLMIKE